MPYSLFLIDMSRDALTSGLRHTRTHTRGMRHLRAATTRRLDYTTRRERRGTGWRDATILTTLLGLERRHVAMARAMLL